MTSKDIAIIGGTFNPVHKGHIMMAKYLSYNYIVDEVWMLPAYKPPHKKSTEICSYDDRCEMLNLCVEDIKRVKVVGFEKKYYDKKKLEGENCTTYTIDVLNYIVDRLKNIQIHFVVGFDEIIDLSTWHNYKDLMKYYEFYIFDREYYDDNSITDKNANTNKHFEKNNSNNEFDSEVNNKISTETKESRINFINNLYNDLDFKFYYEILDAKISSFSSTEIRSLLKTDRKNKSKICEMIDYKVYDYIIDKGLYL